MSALDRGWGPAPTPRDRMVNVAAGANRVNFPGGVHRDIAPLVVELVRRVEKATGERAIDGWCWGYAPRTVRGSTTVWSNHAWGLAVDFNAPKHPLGASGTWGSHGPAISRIAGDLGFRWGGDYSSRKDEMHFEFMGTPDDARRRIAALENDMAEGHSPIDTQAHSLASVPDWSPWAEYVDAGGSTVPKSGVWPASRADIAWFWDNFVRPLEGKVTNLQKELKIARGELTDHKAGHATAGSGGSTTVVPDHVHGTDGSTGGVKR